MTNIVRFIVSILYTFGFKKLMDEVHKAYLVDSLAKNDNLVKSEYITELVNREKQVEWKVTTCIEKIN